MAKSNLASEIRSRIEAVASELTGMIRQEAMAAVTAALGGNGSAPARRRGPGRPRGRRRGPGRPRAKRGHGRPPSATAEALAPKVLAQVKSKAGQSVSDIAKALRVDVERVKPVMAKLVAAKQVKKTGERRGTKYHAAGSGAAAAPKRTARNARKAKRKASRKRSARKATRKPAARKAPRRKATRKRLARKAPRRKATHKRPTRKAPRRKAAKKGARKKVTARKAVRKAPVAPKSTTQELAEAVAKGA